MFQVSIQTDKSYKLPKIVDPDGDLIEVDVLYMSKGTRSQDFPDFISFRANAKEFRVTPMDPLQVGLYPFQIDLKDNHRYPKKKTYNFIIEVTKFSSLERARIEANLNKRVIGVNLTSVEITDRGLLRLRFDHTVFKGDLKGSKAHQ